MARRITMALAGSLLAWLSASPAQAATNAPVVLELFTSQSCSSCPPADALMKQLAGQDSSLLVLSYHVDYWDHLSWKDTYSSPQNTQRQQAYNQVLGAGVFTPQLIINGAASMVGSDEAGADRTIALAKQAPAALAVAIAPHGGQLAVTIQGSGQAASGADIWEVHFDRYAKTNVLAGENGGRTLESINNVTSIKRLGGWAPKEGASTLMIDAPREDGVAILVQQPAHGRILGAASFVRN